MDVRARALVREAQIVMRNRGWLTAAPRDRGAAVLIVNKKVDTIWDLLLETRHDLRRVRGHRSGPLKTGRYA